MDIKFVERKVHEICGNAGIGIKIPVRINGRLTKVLGRVKYADDDVTPTVMEFSRNYLSKATESDIYETIIHECAHVVATVRTGVRHGHDSYFKEVYKELGGNHIAEGAGHPVSWAVEESQVYKYTAYCTECGEFLCGASTSRTKWVSNFQNCLSNCCNAPVKVTQNW